MSYHRHDYAECYTWEMSMKGTVLLVLLVIAAPFLLIECAGAPRYREQVTVIEKTFTGGRHTCYRLKFRSSRGDGDQCVEPEDYLATTVGSRRVISFTRGRITGNIYPESK